MRAAARLVHPDHRADGAATRRAVAGKVVVVTGASHGIGRATAQRLARSGARVLLVARSQDVLDELAAELGDGARAFPCDLRDQEAVGALAQDLLDAHGHVDVVVSNAGKSIRRPVADSYDRMHDFTRTIDVNYLGPVRLLLGLLPEMRRRGSGHIVNVSTVGVLIPPAPRWSAYVASKTAFDTWLRSVSAEVAADGVTTTSVYMALVHTRMSAPTSDFTRVPGLTAEQAAGLVCRAIAERPASIAPWWATAAGVAGQVARRPVAQAMRRYGERLAG